MGDRTSVLDAGGRTLQYYPVLSVEGAERLPFSLRILLENVLRNASDDETARVFAERVVSAGLAGEQGGEIEYMPARVLLQDFTGVPVFVDLAVMREAARDLGGDPTRINPQIPLDLVVDHSVIADVACCPGALEKNMEMEFARNEERYRFLKWAQDSFENVRIVPPGAGICHQINVERFATGVMTGENDEGEIAYFDTVVGTDSHTTTANGIGVLSWGVGGIEAEAAALGQPITTLVPRVIGVHLTGALREGVSAMDAALTFAQMLREKGVVGCFVECFGEGVSTLSATQRACIANMTPEYGCTCTLFPFDDRTLEYLRLTGRSQEQVELVEGYAKAQGLWNDGIERVYSDVVELDLSTVECSLAGPSRPHNRFAAASALRRFVDVCAERSLDESVVRTVDFAGSSFDLTHGAIAIAAVTSCTTATDPAMMVACGLVAKHAREAGLQAKPWVKRVMAPGSHATQLMLERAGLADPLAELGFSTCGFGCMSCIGNSGPVWPQMHDIAEDIELTSVLSGNRNFDGRISPDVSQNYLCSPALVVAYAMAGTMDFDFESDPLGADADGNPVFLRDIWPSDEEIDRVVAEYVTEELFEEGGKGLYDGTEAWKALEVEPSDIFAWDADSTYVRKAPYFEGMRRELDGCGAIEGARVLVNVRDFITTDHISPAGSIASDSPAARYLRERGVADEMFNTYGARRGNHEVMARGGFGNVKLSNLLADGRNGGYTRDFTTGDITSIFEASERYAQSDTPCVVLAGKMYGSGSSRDWAAKAPLLLGVRAVFAESFERIHRSNLVGMGILPLQFLDGESVESLGLDGTETFTIERVDFGDGSPQLPEPRTVKVTASRQDASSTEFQAIVRVDTPTEGAYMAHGGILQYVLRHLAEAAE
ncbi:aconitate hydratase AcnA [Slackia faecicanis]|uniref:Aconitate hydratase n=1 Tax=Slackia faecicanis TaxID=255723 RepID=A0A3N0AHH3_9ACTN|nr:aconitate hydratase AcnA [Slackia faecicanis]RNL21280.1 aconitate hydratase AcnA [Slackia faecicanis]